ncbi:MAG TPA: hypothetical protein VN924_28335 [Bryobacteraceae bacterium]|nr:hypothetical protein [Bryobacteraceae bacterium]
MIPALRERFNAAFTPEKYAAFLARMEAQSGTPLAFRHSETPCFFPAPLIDAMAREGADLIRQLTSPEYLAIARQAVPPQYDVPGEPDHPLFLQVDFGLVREAPGQIAPRLVEIQAFPSLYAYQPVLSQMYIDTYNLDPQLRYLLSGLDLAGYKALLGRAILGGHDPENVILMEIDPLHQKTLADFVLTERMLGVRAVCITQIRKDGKVLYYERDGRKIPIHRIYNRAIVDELQRRGIAPAFDFRDDLDVEWAGHPNDYFRVSKFSIPYLRHPSVPQTWFLDQLHHIPQDTHNYVLKPLFSFAGLGVRIGPPREEIMAIPAAERRNYILQERVRFEPVIETPHGKTMAEIRIMYIWLDELQPVSLLVRMGRGAMMGVDHNKNLEWVGASAGLLSNFDELAQPEKRVVPLL